MAAPKRIRVAKIGAAHGIRGEVRLFVDADDPLEIRKLGTLEDEAGIPFKIAALREGKGHLIVRFEGISDRNAVERLRHRELFVPRERLAEHTEANTYYRADLVGLRVETKDGAPLGTINAIQNFGAGDLLEIARADGGATFLIPFVDRYVPEVDIEQERVIVDPPEGSFE